MVAVENQPRFEKKIRRIKDSALKLRLKKQIRKIIQHPKTGKPMMNVRKGTREVHIPPFRLSYRYFEKEDKIVFLDVYHKDEQ